MFLLTRHKPTVRVHYNVNRVQNEILCYNVASILMDTYRIQKHCPIQAQ